MQLARVVFKGHSWRRGREGVIPVTAYVGLGPAGQVESQGAAGREQPDPGEQRLIAENVLEGEVFVEGFVADIPAYLRVLQDGFNLGGEEEDPTLEIPVEGLDAEAVAGQEEPAAG